MAKPLHVWVVDDDQSVRWVLEKALRQAGMETRSFERAEHLLDAIESESPDVLIRMCACRVCQAWLCWSACTDACPGFPLS